MPVLAALEQAGLIGKIKFGTFDLSPNVLKALSDGKMMFAIDQQQYLQGYLPVVILPPCGGKGTGIRAWRIPAAEAIECLWR